MCLEDMLQFPTTLSMDRLSKLQYCLKPKARIHFLVHHVRMAHILNQQTMHQQIPMILGMDLVRLLFVSSSYSMQRPMPSWWSIVLAMLNRLRWSVIFIVMSRALTRCHAECCFWTSRHR